MKKLLLLGLLLLSSMSLVEARYRHWRYGGYYPYGYSYYGPSFGFGFGSPYYGYAPYGYGSGLGFSISF